MWTARCSHASTRPTPRASKRWRKSSCKTPTFCTSPTDTRGKNKTPTDPVIASPAQPGVAIHPDGLLRRPPRGLLAMTKPESLVLGGGCFWCLDASFQLLRGIVHVTCGYAGGQVENPSYEQVCTDKTG